MMTEEKLEKIFNLYILFCKKVHGTTLYGFQRQIAMKTFRVVFYRTGEDIYAQISRQAGKTETVVSVIEFLMIFYPKIMKRPFRCGIFAPQKEQTKTDFDRLKDRLEVSYKFGIGVTASTDESNAVTLQLENGSFCYAFPLTKTSSPESKTLDFVVYEEANKISDKEKKDKSDPMRASTNGGSLSCGVAGYKGNYFKRGVDKLDDSVMRFDDIAVIKERQIAFEKDGNDYHLNYRRFVERVIADIGEDDESFQTQFRLNWKIGSGSFITPEQLHALRGDFSVGPSKNPVVVGIDSAKYPDRWIVTVKDIVEKKIVGWLRLQGDNYEDMFYATLGWLEKNYTDVEQVVIDSTGQGDFVPDMFDNHSDYEIVRVKFTLQSKDAIYKNLLVQIKNAGTKYPYSESRECKEFEAEALDMEREYKGEFLSCHHPDESGAHDDYMDSWALAEWGHHLLVENEPDISVIESGDKRNKVGLMVGKIGKRDEAEDDDDSDLIA